jgi:hypothetical protein
VRYKGKTIKNTVSIGAGCGVEFFFWRFCVHFTTGIFGSKRSDDLKKIGLEVAQVSISGYEAAL